MPARKEDRVHVCALADVEDMVSATGAGHLVSALQTSLIPPTPMPIAPDRHLKIAIDDIEAPSTGLLHARGQDIAQLRDFAVSWDRASPIVVHCWAGVSRSTAAAFIALCAINPHIPEHRIARYLRNASPAASPNRLLVALGDEVLERHGRMIKAIKKIGHGYSAPLGHPFSLPATFSSREKHASSGYRAA